MMAQGKLEECGEYQLAKTLIEQMFYFPNFASFTTSDYKKQYKKFSSLVRQRMWFAKNSKLISLFCDVADQDEISMREQMYLINSLYLENYKSDRPKGRLGYRKPEHLKKKKFKSLKQQNPCLYHIISTRKERLSGQSY